MSEILMNFQSGVLSAAPGAAGTTLTSGNFGFLPTIVAPHTLRIALDPDGAAGTPEIVTVTAHGAAATTCTVLRGQESAFGAGPARAHAVDTAWRHVLTRASILEMAVPAASVIATTAATPDPGYVFIDGSTIVNGQMLYPMAWARIPGSWKAAPNIVLPDWRGRTLFSDDAAALFALGGSGGANTHLLTQAELPAATITIDPPAFTIDPPSTIITIDPPNTAVTGSTGVESVPHTHLYNKDSGASTTLVSGAGVTVKVTPNQDWGTGNESVQHTHPAGTLAVDIAPFNATVDIAPFNVDPGSFASGPLGSGAAIDTRPAYGVVNFQIKVH